MKIEIPAEEETIISEELDRLLSELIEDKPKKNDYIYDDEGRCTNRIDLSAKVYHPEALMQEEQASSVELPVSVAEVLVSAVVVPSNVIETPLAEVYQFPHENSNYTVALIQYQGIAAETLKAKLDTLSLCHGKPQDVNHYIKNRVEICAISIALNIQCRYSPFLRSFCNIGSKVNTKVWTLNERAMLNDLRVIDLHWLYCTGRFNSAAQHSEIFADKFNFDNASLFAADNRFADTKVTELGLPKVYMLPLKTLKSKQITERHRTIRVQLNNAPSLISKEKLKSSCRLASTERELIDIAIATLLADGNIVIAGEVYAQLTGKTINTEILRKRIHWLLGKKIVNPSRES